jgi:hypothetical protein
MSWKFLGLLSLKYLHLAISIRNFHGKWALIVSEPHHCVLSINCCLSQ